MGIRAYALLAAALALAPGHLCAQGFKPTRAVDIVVHTGPGGGSDVFARAMNMIIEDHKLLPVRANILNKPGGGGAAALAYVAEKKGDAHTLAIYTTVWMTSALTSAEVRAQFKDLTPIANLIYDVELAAVRADSPFKTLGDFIEAAKKNPRQLIQVGGSVESRANLVRQLLQRATGASWQYIPHPGGGDRIAAVLGGHAQLLIMGPDEIKQHLAAGTLRAIVQVADKRLASQAHVPTIQEAGYKIPNVRSLRGIAAPPGLPKDAQEYWEGVFSRMVKTDAWRKFLADAEAEDGFVRGSELHKVTDEILVQRREIYREIGIKLMR